MVPAFLADDAEHPRRRTVTSLTGRHARARDAAGAVVNRDVLIGQRNDGVDRSLGTGLLGGFLLGRVGLLSCRLGVRRAALFDDALTRRALVAKEVAKALLGGQR